MNYLKSIYRIGSFYRCAKGSSVTRCDSGTSAGAPTGSNGYVVDGRLCSIFR